MVNILKDERNMENLVNMDELKYVTETVTKIYKELRKILDIIKKRDTIKVGKLEDNPSYDGVMFIKKDGSVNMYEYETIYRLLNFSKMLTNAIYDVSKIKWQYEKSHFYLKDFFIGVRNTIIDIINLELFQNKYFEIFGDIYRNNYRIPQDYKPLYFEL
jgi:hypothetical protein